jgi:predicted MFS family arabinose efflux permease
MGVPSRVLGNFSIAAQITVVFGLPLGGILAGAFGWRALFVVNIPLALITIAFTLAGVARDRPMERQGGQRLLTPLDVPGIVLFTAAVTSLLLFLSGRAVLGWVLGGLGILVLLLAALDSSIPAITDR